MNRTLLIFSLTFFSLSSCNFENKSQKENMNEQIQQEDVRTPYTPYGLDITYANWNYKYARIKEFEDFTVTLTNKTNENFKMVRYRIKLYVNENGSKREVFSKSYEYYQRLNAGDIIRIPVYDLTGFYMGVNVSENDNFSWTGYIEDSEVIK